MPNEMEIRRKSSEMLERANALEITDNKAYVAADKMQVVLKEFETAIVNDHKEAKFTAWMAHKAAVAAEAKDLEPVTQARKVLKTKMAAWEDKLEKERVAEEERQRKEREKEAAAEREKARKAALKSGDKELAKEIAAAPLQVAPVVLPSAVPESKTTIRKIKKFRIMDATLVKREFLTPDEVKIGGVVRSMGKAAEALVGGIEVYEVAC